MDTLPGASKEIHAQLKRRLLLINIEGGAGSAAQKALGQLQGLDIIPTPIDTLKEILCSRELDPASLEFLSCIKMKLDLEDSAVLASLLEQERSELALAISEKPDGDGKVVTLSLYCSHSTFPDVINIRCKDESQLEEGLGRFISQWQAQALADMDGGGDEGGQLRPRPPSWRGRARGQSISLQPCAGAGLREAEPGHRRKDYPWKRLSPGGSVR